MSIDNMIMKQQKKYILNKSGAKIHTTLDSYLSKSQSFKYTSQPLYIAKTPLNYV